VCVCIVALVLWHANHIFSAPHYIVTCDLSGSTIFFHSISLMAQISERGY